MLAKFKSSSKLSPDIRLGTRLIGVSRQGRRIVVGYDELVRRRIKSFGGR
jgi:hypothetical protein